MSSLYGTTEDLNVKGATAIPTSNGWTIQLKPWLFSESYKESNIVTQRNQIIQPNFVECFCGVDWSIAPGNEDKDNPMTGKN